MRQPFAESNIGADVADDPTFRRFLDAPSGAFVAGSAGEDIERHHAFTSVGDLPLVLDVAPSLPHAHIDERAIQQRGAVFAADILADVPGLSVTRTGAFGGLAQVRMRGATPGKTLVLVDGVPVNDPTEPNGAFDFSGFELGDIQRIEVLSGPQSSLWGSDAIGGVIQYITLSGRDAPGFSARAEGGSFGTFSGGARAAGFYVAAVYREKASGARPDRPELLRMVADLQPGEVVVAEKIDRISRLPLPARRRTARPGRTRRRRPRGC